MGCTNKSAIWSTTQSWVFLAPECVVQVQRWSPSGSTWNFLQPQTEIGNSVKAGILAPTQEAKNVWQRLADQVSSLWWVLICPNQLIGLNQSTRLGSSSSWDSRLAIFVRRTESSTVVTTWYRNVGIVLIPHSVSLMDSVELWKWEGCVILLLRVTVLGAESIITPYMSLWLWQYILTIVLIENFGVDVTEEQKRGRWPRGRVLKIILRQSQDLTFLGEST